MTAKGRKNSIRRFLPLSFLLPLSVASAYGHAQTQFLNTAELNNHAGKVHNTAIHHNVGTKHVHSNLNGLDITSVNHKGADHALDFDLSATTANITLSNKFFHGPNHQSVSITRNGETVLLQAGSKVTAAEYAAFAQAKNGSQTIVLDAHGAASGGTVNLNAVESGHKLNFSDLVIPVGVDAFYSASGKNALTVFGNIDNFGSLYSLVNGHPQSSVDTRIVAGSINNASGAEISAINGNSLSQSANQSVVSNINFSIFATHSINNSGTISSTGNLTLATDWLTNAGTISANSKANITAQSGINNGLHGLIAGQNGLNINTPSVQNIGSIHSTNGNVGFDGGTGNLNVFGPGTLAASKITFIARNGTVDVEVGSIDGKVSVKAVGSSVVVNKGALNVETVDVSGDPIFVSNTDSVILPASIVTGGAPVTAIAAKDILGAASTGTTIDTSAAAGGGDVFLLAGAISSTINGITTVLGASGFGGSISGIKSINASGDTTSTNTHGGNITLGAFGGGISTGNLTANGGTTGQGSRTVAKQSGHIMVFSPGDIHVGTVQTAGIHMNRSENFIYIANADPIINSPLSFDSQGTKTQGTISPGALGTGSVYTGVLDAGLRTLDGLNSGSIFVQSGGSISTGSVLALGGGGGENYHFEMLGYNANSPGGSGGNVFLSAANGNVVINGDLNTSGGGGGGANHTAGGKGGDGGSVSISATGDIIINGPLLTPGGGGGGGSGISSEDTAGGGGSFGNGGGPNSGALYRMVPPYNGPATLDRGVVPSNPNHPRFPYPGMGGTNTAYDIGCCGSAYGGDVGNFGGNGTTGTFQRGWWDDTTPHPGGAPGLAGNITLTGRDIKILQTIGSYYGNTNQANLSPYAGYSMFAHSQLGGGTVTITATGSQTASGFLSIDGDFSSTNATVLAQLRPAQVTIAGLSRANFTSINGTTKPDIFAGGVFNGNFGPQISITENGAQKQISIGQAVTPAEWAALLQVSTDIPQSLTLNAGGAAIGGGYTLTTANTPTSGFTNFVVPTATTFIGQLPTLNVQNQATVNGTLSFTQTSTFNAANISMADNSRIESTGSNNNLTLSAPNFALGNNAIISSSGNLSLSSGAAANISIGVASGATAQLRSGTNSVSIAAPNGAVNFNSLGGTPSALYSDKLQLKGNTIAVSSNFLLQADDTINANVAGGTFNNSGTIQSVLESGSGGSITVHGTGDLSVQTGNLLVASSQLSGGSGGTIDIGSTGILTLNGPSLNAAATGSGDNDGGSIYLMAVDIINASGVSFSLNANATGGGNGGLVSIIKTGTAADINLSGANNAFNISARGGSSAGNGGDLRLSSGRDIFIDNAFVNLSNGSANGSGAKYTLAAGTAGSGNATINGNVDVSGHGLGAGGKFVLSTNSTSALSVGNSSGYGVYGQINANGGNTSGDAGQISLTNAGSGGINLTSTANFSTTTNDGKGASINLVANSGDILATGGLLDARAGGSNGDGGFINLDAQHIVVGGSGPLALRADGSGSGKGGLVSIQTHAQDSDIALDNSDSNLLVSATGGSSGSASGDGGIISVSAGRNITATSGALNARPLGNSGNGANLTLTAGNATTGTVSIADNIDSAAAAQGGNAGHANITYNSTQAFTVGSSSANGIGGAILANSQNGAGGSIQIDNRDSSGITILNTSSIDAGNGSVVLWHNGGIVSATGSGSISGNITASADSINLKVGSGDLVVQSATAKNGALNLQADAGAITINQAATATAQNTITARDSIQLNSALPITGASLSLTSQTGDIGSAAQALKTAVTILSANTGGSGIVNIVNQSASDLNLLPSTSGGNFTLTTGGALTINGIVTAAGSINTQNNLGLLHIAPGAQVIANDGNISLINNYSGKKTGILIDAGATIKASSNLAQYGNVYIGYGPQQATPVAGKLPKQGVHISISNNGQIYLDKVKFKFPNKKLPTPSWTANGRNILFNSGPKKQPIQIGAGSSIVADPPNLTLFSPQENMQINTAFGVVSLAANSLVLMASGDSSVSIYDLDDAHKDSVSIATAGGKISLSPGRHITLASSDGSTFHDLNPIESIGHRSFVQKQLSDEHVAHISEFHVISAIESVPMLAQMARGEHPHLKKKSEHLLKTAAILLQLGGVADYQTYEHPSLAAFNQ